MRQLFLGLMSVGLLLGVTGGGCDYGETACESADKIVEECGIDPGQCDDDEEVDSCVARCITLVVDARVVVDGSATSNACTILENLAEGLRTVRAWDEGNSGGKLTIEPLYSHKRFEQVALTIAGPADSGAAAGGAGGSGTVDAGPPYPADQGLPLNAYEIDQGGIGQDTEECLAHCYFNP